MAYEIAKALIAIIFAALLWPLGYVAATVLLTAAFVARDRLEDAAHQVRKRLQSMMNRP